MSAAEGDWSKKSVQQGRSLFDVRSVLSVREHGKRATCLREAATAKAENAAGGFFQHSQNRNTTSLLRLKFPFCLAEGKSEVMMEDCDGWVSDIVLHILPSGIQIPNRGFSMGRDVMPAHPLFYSSLPYLLLGCGHRCAFEGRSGTRF